MSKECLLITQQLNRIKISLLTYFVVTLVSV